MIFAPFFSLPLAIGVFCCALKLPLRIKKRTKGGREWFVHDVQCAEGIMACASVGWMELRGITELTII